MIVKFWLETKEEVDELGFLSICKWKIEETCEVPDDFDDEWGYSQIDNLQDAWIGNRDEYVFGLVDKHGWTWEV